MFQVVQGSAWKHLVLYQEVTHGNPVNQELATPGVAATGSPPWAAPAAVISMCGEVGLEGRLSLWSAAGWWACGDLGVLSQSHLRTGWQWGSRIPEVLCSVPRLAGGRASASSMEVCAESGGCVSGREMSVGLRRTTGS